MAIHFNQVTGCSPQALTKLVEEATEYLSSDAYYYDKDSDQSNFQNALKKLDEVKAGLNQPEASLDDFIRELNEDLSRFMYNKFVLKDFFSVLDRLMSFANKNPEDYMTEDAVKKRFMTVFNISLDLFRNLNYPIHNYRFLLLG